MIKEYLFKKNLGFLLAVSMIFSLTPANIYANSVTTESAVATGSVTDPDDGSSESTGSAVEGAETSDPDTDEPVISGTFDYQMQDIALVDNTEIYSDTYYYSDSYFAESSTTSNPHLRTMSAILAVTTGQSKSVKTRYTTSLLKDIGFTDIETAEIDITTADSIGTYIAHKIVGDHDLITVVIRSSNYANEWANNVLLGKEGDAKGFSESADKVLDRITKYMDDHSLNTANKIWITGYSRGGTVADLLGKKINQQLNDFNTTEDDLFVYTLDSPGASVSDDCYENIHNVINFDDPVTALLPKNFGFHLSGIEEPIGEVSTKLPLYCLISDDISMLLFYKSLNKGIEKKYSENYGRNIIIELFNWATTHGLTRKYYSKNVEEPLSCTLDFYYSRSSKESKALKKLMTVYLPDEIKDDLKPILKAFNYLYNHNSEKTYEYFTDTLLKYVDNAYETASKTEDTFAISDEEFEEFRTYLYHLVKALSPILIKDFLDDESLYPPVDDFDPYNENDSDNDTTYETTELNAKTLNSSYSEDKLQRPLRHFYTLIKNVNLIFEPHYAQNLLPLLMKLDSFYEKTDGQKPSDSASGSSVTARPVVTDPPILIPTEEPVITTPEPTKSATTSATESPSAETPSDDASPAAPANNTSATPANNASANSPTTNATATYIPTPEIKSVINKKSGICLKWEKLDNATSYEVYVLEDSTRAEGMTATLIGETDADTTKYIDKSTKKENGKKYFYFIKAYVNSGLALTSSTIAVLRLTGVKLKTPSENKLKWKKDKKADGYQIKYEKDSKTEKIMIEGKNNVSFKIKKSDAKKKYKYQIRAYKKLDKKTFYSPWSKKVSLKK